MAVVWLDDGAMKTAFGMFKTMLLLLALLRCKILLKPGKARLAIIISDQYTTNRCGAKAPLRRSAAEHSSYLCRF